MIRLPDKLVKADDNLFLPDFCNVYTVFLMVIVTELLAFVLTLVPLGKMGYDWDYVHLNLMTDLAMVSWFMQWVTLVSMTVLCSIRRMLVALKSDWWVGFFSYLLILTVTVLVSELAWGLNEYSFSFESPLSYEYYWFLLKYLGVATVLSIIGLLGAYYCKLFKTHTLIFSYVVILSTTLFVSEIAAWLNSTVGLRSAQHGLFLWRNLAISAIISAMALRYFYIQAQWQKELAATANAQLQALRARIDPHFLFNSMNTIASLIRFDPQRAEQTVEDFADLFRIMLAETKELVTWQEEVALCTQYLRIESSRLNERLQINWQTDAIPKDALLPALCLQPLLENAIYHGIQSLPQGGTIELTGQCDGKLIQLNITNPKDPNSPSAHQGHQVAQDNIRQRLQAHYGHQADFQVENQAECYQVKLRFPYYKTVGATNFSGSNL